MKKLIIALTSMIVLASTGIGYTQEKSALETNKAKLLITLPTEYNTPDGAALDIDGNIILSIPNFNNNRLIETGKLKEPSQQVFLSTLKLVNRGKRQLMLGRIHRLRVILKY